MNTNNEDRSWSCKEGLHVEASAFEFGVHSIAQRRTEEIIMLQQRKRRKSQDFRVYTRLCVAIHEDRLPSWKDMLRSKGAMKIYALHCCIAVARHLPARRAADISLLIYLCHLQYLTHNTSSVYFKLRDTSRLIATSRSKDMSAPIRPLSPTGPSSASVTTTTTTTTTTSTSPPRSTTLLSTSGSTSGAGPASSVSSPPPIGPGPAAIIAQQQQQGAHRPPPPAPSSQQHRRLSIPLPSPTNPTTLPTPSQTAQIAQARDALVASLGNALDTELQSRASLLHSNQRAIEKQERDVGRALEELRKEDEKLMKVLNEGSRKVKELGDVQNWAERLERDFLVVEETMRLVHEGDSSGSWSGSGSESGSWSGSESGSERGGEAGYEEGDVRMSDYDGEGKGEAKLAEGAAMAPSTDKGKQVEALSPDAMDVDVGPSPSYSGHDTAQGSGSSSIVTAVKTSEHDTVSTPLSSPGTGNWLKRFIWRS